MPPPRRIGTEYLAIAVSHHVNARNHAYSAVECRSLLRFYGGPGHGLSEHAAEAMVGSLSRSIAHHDRNEGQALLLLNLAFRDGGARPGDEVEVLGHLYRAANDGCPAVYLGGRIPAEEPGLAPGPQDDRSEAAERASEYAEMVKVPN